MKKEHLSTDKSAKNKEEKLDNLLSDSFPTSDPPSHSPGTVGADHKPKSRQPEVDKGPERGAPKSGKH